MYKDLKVSAIITAGGKGLRMKKNAPKQFLTLNNKSILMHTVLLFENLNAVDEIIIVGPVNYIDEIKKMCQKEGITKVNHIIQGGETRRQSVRNGLDMAQGNIILIHDGVRPFTTSKEVLSVIDAVHQHGAAALCTPITDTIKLFKDNKITKTVDRNAMVAVQTPQGFKADIIKKAHHDAALQNKDFTDDCGLCEDMGIHVQMVTGSNLNIKITTPEDLILAEAIINTRDNSINQISYPRVGFGYDVHRFTENRKLILGGVDIPYTLGLLGHSDADVLLHAISDSLLGAAALGDIGVHFPDTDTKWKDADSGKLLEHVNTLLSNKGYTIINIDATIIAQKPKLCDYIPKMRENISNILKTDIDNISIKATTTERLGFCGRGEGIAAEAICNIIKA